MKAFTALLFTIKGQGGGRAFIYRGLIRKHKFFWNQNKRRHELGPFTVEQFDELKTDILEGGFKPSVSVELCGLVELPKGIAVEAVETMQPASEPDNPRHIPVVQAERIYLPENINPNLVPEILTEADLKELQQLNKPQRDERFDGEVLEVESQIGDEESQESEPDVSEVEEVVNETEQPVDEPVPEEVEEATPTESLQSETPRIVHTKKSLKDLSVEEQYAILKEWNITGISNLRGKETYLIKRILLEQSKQAE